MKYLAIFTVLFLSACTMVAPPYKNSMDNLQHLKRSSLELMAVGNIEDNKKLNSISLRGSSLVSPNNKSFGDYLESALQSELTAAKLYSGVSSIVIAGKLIENDIDVSGFSVGDGKMTVEFVVTNKNSVIFTKSISVTHEFESSFIGSIAIPNGQLNYPVLVQKLCGALFNDPDFMKATQR